MTTEMLVPLQAKRCGSTGPCLSLNVESLGQKTHWPFRIWLSGTATMKRVGIQEHQDKQLYSMMVLLSARIVAVHALTVGT